MIYQPDNRLNRARITTNGAVCGIYPIRKWAIREAVGGGRNSPRIFMNLGGLQQMFQCLFSLDFTYSNTGTLANASSMSSTKSQSSVLSLSAMPTAFLPPFTFRTASSSPSS